MPPRGNASSSTPPPGFSISSPHLETTMTPKTHPDPIFRAAPRALLATALAMAGLFAATGAQAQDWPTKPVKLVVSYPPGGTVDAVARIIAPRLSARLGQPVVIDNRAGAGGAI